VSDAVEYLILGPLVVRSPFDVRTPTAKKERLLLIRLLIDAETVVSTDELLDALWGPRPPTTARKLVQQYVGALRSRLGQRAIETVEEGYRLRAAPAEIDRNRFEHLAAEGRRLLRAGNPSLAATTLRRALDLWRGPAYLEARYEEFARIDAERLDELHLDCIDACLEAEAASGITVGAVAAFTALSGGVSKVMVFLGTNHISVPLRWHIEQLHDMTSGISPSTSQSEISPSKRNVVKKSPEKC